MSWDFVGRAMICGADKTGDCAMSIWAKLFHAANHDFCPSANRWVYWMKHPATAIVFVSPAIMT